MANLSILALHIDDSIENELDKTQRVAFSRQYLV